MSQAICDFCSGPRVAWRYPARSFVAYVVASIGGESVGDWAACDECHDLIEASDREGLTERSLEALIEKHPEMTSVRDTITEHMAGLHILFFENRTGAATPVQ
jgi:hypothetical protein